MVDYRFELSRYLKNEYKKAKKDKVVYSENIKNELELLIKNANDKKLEVIYKYRYFIFNNGIKINELDDIYRNLFRKILFASEKSPILLDNWENIFHTIFGNMPAIYNKHGKEFINRVVSMFYCAKNEEKLKVLMQLFAYSYHLEGDEIKYLDSLLKYIEKTELKYILNSYEVLAKSLSSMVDNITIKVDKIEYIFEMFSRSKSEYNSKKLEELLEIYEENIIDNENLYELFEIVCTSDNRDFIESLVNLMNNDDFRHLDNNIQKRCISILKNIDKVNFLNIRLSTKIILEIILLNEKKLQDFLLSKLEMIKNPESLQLIISLTPLLNEFIDDEEYIRVIDSIEDKDNNMTKKLIINLNNE